MPQIRQNKPAKFNNQSMSNGARLQDIVKGIGQQEIDLFNTFTEMCESHISKVNTCSPAIIEVIADICKMLRGEMCLEERYMCASCHNYGSFSFRVGYPDGLVSFNILRYLTDGSIAEIGEDGNLLLWKNNRLCRRNRRDYYSALGAINAILREGEVFAAGPVANYP